MSALILQFPFSAKSAKGKNLPPVKRKDTRDRKHLTNDEVERLITAIKNHGRYGHRNATAILIAYRHGLRCTELCNLQWSQVNFDAAEILIIRAKKGKAGTHPLTGRELRALRRLERDYGGAFVFQSERGTPLSKRAFHGIVQTAGQLASIEMKCHPHMLRHGCGFYLGDDHPTHTIQQYLGHKNQRHTFRYIAENSKRYANLWR